MKYDARAEGDCLKRIQDHIQLPEYDDTWTDEWDELLREANTHAARRHKYNAGLAG